MSGPKSLDEIFPDWSGISIWHPRKRMVSVARSQIGGVVDIRLVPPTRETWMRSANQRTSRRSARR